jgi:hypothetical protein
MTQFGQGDTGTRVTMNICLPFAGPLFLVSRSDGYLLFDGWRRWDNQCVTVAEVMQLSLSCLPAYFHLFVIFLEHSANLHFNKLT